MRYNTGNPVGPDGSSSPFDLHDNSGIADQLVNGSERSYPGRLGNPLKSFHGMNAEFDESQSSKEAQFQQFLISSGYQPLGDYAAGINITTRNQIIRKDGEYYRVAASTALPYTTTGTWAGESSKFVSVGDAALRQQMAAAGGSALSEYSGRTVEGRLAEMPSPIDKPFSAAGNSTTNDTASFASFEGQHKGKTVDLGGKTYLVNSIPQANNYVNGKFKVVDATFHAGFFNDFMSGVPRFTKNGGQLKKIKEDLGNPLVQFVGMVVCSDSIGWGHTSGGQAPSSPQTAFLNTARNNSTSPSFWNNFRRYIGSQYMKGATLTLGNWAASPSGESIATYVRDLTIYPKDGPFTLTSVGQNQGASSAANAISPTGFMYTLQDGFPGGTASQSIKFNFTGDTFRILFRATNNGDFQNYSLYVDGLLIGTYTCEPGVDGVVVGYTNKRTHTFGYVRNKVVEIRTNSAGLTGVRNLFILGIEIPKTVRMTNQAITGATAHSYDANALSGLFSNPTAVTPYDQFVFCQFGTNDRGDTSRPPGAAEFERALQAIVNRLSPIAEVIMMCANPAADSVEPPTPVSMTMRDVRGVIAKVAKANSLDFVDNLAAFDRLDSSVFLADNVHPNALGHAIISRNIINSLESD